MSEWGKSDWFMVPFQVEEQKEEYCSDPVLWKADLERGVAGFCSPELFCSPKVVGALRIIFCSACFRSMVSIGIIFLWRQVVNEFSSFSFLFRQNYVLVLFKRVD